MAIIRYLQKLELLDKLIRRKATGNQNHFAKKVNLSRSMLNEYLKEMKQLGFPINYCRSRNTYYYEEEGQIVKSLFETKTADDELKKISGGKQFAQQDIPSLSELSSVCDESPILLDYRFQTLFL